MKIAVYTTIFGDYDSVKPIPQQEVRADYFVITDNPELKADGWKTVNPNFPRRDLHPRMRAKFFKLFPWECKELADYQISIYIDASIRITSANFIATCVKNLTSDMLLFKHPQRRCIYDEGACSLELLKYKDEPIAEQLKFYRKFHPVNGGLYAGGVIVRKHTDVIGKIMGDWWFENIKYSYQDQLSLPVVLKMNGFKPSTFAENQYKNSFLKVEWHDDLGDGRTNMGGGQPRRVAPTETEMITVLMPVWKTPVDLLKRAIDSIINQTDRNFELLIVDDNNGQGEVLDVLNGYIEKGDHAGSPVQVRMIHTRVNGGLAKTLDIGISKANGELIVRMDADDVAHPDLVARQRMFFERNPDAAICGVQLNLMLKDGKIKGVTNHPASVTKRDAVRSRGFWIVNHPGICYRKSVVTEIGGYGDTVKNLAEDYALWCKFLLAGYVIYNLPDVLIDYTLGDGSQIGQDRESKEWVEFLEKTKKALSH